MSEEKTGAELISQILNQNKPENPPAQPAETQAEVGADECYNCHLQGTTTKLKAGVCPACGFEKPRS